MQDPVFYKNAAVAVFGPFVEVKGPQGRFNIPSGLVGPYDSAELPEGLGRFLRAPDGGLDAKGVVRRLVEFSRYAPEGAQLRFEGGPVGGVNVPRYVVTMVVEPSLLSQMLTRWGDSLTNWGNSLAKWARSWGKGEQPVVKSEVLPKPKLEAAPVTLGLETLRELYKKVARLYLARSTGNAPDRRG